MTLLLLLLSLALVDGVFSGVRAGLGRSGLLAQSHLNLRNAWLGLALELMLLPLLLTYGGVCLHLQASVDVDAVRAGGAMLWVLGSYATLVLAVMTLWTIPRSDVRELCSVLVLGPCTFARPYVIIGAVVVGATTTSEPLVWGGVVLAGVLQLLHEPLANRWHLRRQEEQLAQLWARVDA